MAMTAGEIEPLAAAKASGTSPLLIGFADALAAPETVWSLQALGRPIVAFARRGRPPALRRCHGVEIVEVTAPERDSAQAVRDVTELIRTLEPAAVMPLDDSAVWLCAAATGGLDVPLAGPTGPQAQLALDKRLQLDAAARAGLAVPATRVVESVEALLALEDLPVQVKPAEPVADLGGRLVRGRNHICANREELEAAAAAWNGVQPLLVQPLISGVGEGIFGVAGPDGVRAWSAHRRLRMMNPEGSGSSACAAAPVESGLAAAVERMLLDIGWSGLFMVELLRDRDGTPWFMELNGRPWGSMALARSGGLEYPEWALRQRLEPGFEVPAVDAFRPRTCRHLGREIVHVLMVLRGPRSEAIATWPSRRRTLLDVLRVRRDEHWYNWDRRDPLVLVEDTWRTVSGQLPGRLPWRRSA